MLTTTKNINADYNYDPMIWDHSFSDISQGSGREIPTGEPPLSFPLRQRVIEPAGENSAGTPMQNMPADFTFLNDLSIPPSFILGQGPSDLTLLNDLNTTLFFPEQGVSDPPDEPDEPDEPVKLTEPLPPLSWKLLKNNEPLFLQCAAQAIGTQVNNITLVHSGSGGVVFEYQQKERAPTAIKLHYGYHNPKTVAHEINIMRQLCFSDYSYMPSFYGAYYSNSGKVWLHSMELYPATLGDLLKNYRTGLPEPVARVLIRDLLQGLAELNQRGFMHRDIKPDNILLPQKTLDAINQNQLESIKQPLLRITDYGETKLIAQDGRHTPVTGTYRYQFSYMDDGYYNESVDVSAVGIIFYELIMGQKFLSNLPPIYELKKETTEQDLQQHISQAQENRRREIKEQLTGKRALKNIIIDEEMMAQWNTWIQQGGEECENCPIKQYLGLFRLIEGPDWQHRLQDGQAKKLSAAGFLALCDLMKIKGPDNAAQQLKQKYWKPAVVYFLTKSTPASLIPTNQESIFRHFGSNRKYVIGLGFTCKNCEFKKSFWSIKAWRRHRNSHYICPLCHTYPERPVFKNYQDATAELVRHITEKHGKKEQTRLGEMVMSMRAVPKEVFRSLCLLKKVHYKGFIKDKPFHRFFHSQSELQKHKSHHREENRHKCTLCPASFEWPSGLKRHQLTHTNPAHCCPECSRSFKRKLNLQTHMGFIKGVECKICKAHFSCVTKRKLHMKSHPKKKPIGKAFKCAECGEDYKLQESLRKHMVKAHNYGENKDLPKCGICKKSFLTQSFLMLHERMHSNERPYKCDECDKGFKSPSNLRNHKLTHKKDNPFECDTDVDGRPCGKSFITKSKLKRHQLIHSGNKPHKCDLCDKRFLHNSNLKAHKALHESGIKPHKCDLCDKRFHRKSNLKVHEAIHEKSHFLCPLCLICPKGDIGVAALVRHIKTNHENQLQQLSKRIIQRQESSDDKKGRSTQQEMSYLILGKLHCNYRVNDKLCGQLWESISELQNHQLEHA